MTIYKERMSLWAFPLAVLQKAQEERTYFMIRTLVHTSLRNNEQQRVWLATKKIWSNGLFLGGFQTDAPECCWQPCVLPWLPNNFGFLLVLVEVLHLKITFDTNSPKPPFHPVGALMRFKNKKKVCDFYSPNKRRPRHTAMMGFRIPGSTDTRLSLWL